MPTTTTGLVFAPLLMLLLKGFFYWFAFRIRKIDAGYKTCLIIAASSIFVGLIPGLTMGYVSFPPMIMFGLIIGCAMYMTNRFTDAEIFPDGYVIPILVEIGSIFAEDDVVHPLLALIK